MESAIQAMRGFLDDDESDGILLIDADHAFNRVKRSVALLKIHKIKVVRPKIWGSQPKSGDSKCVKLPV